MGREEIRGRKKLYKRCRIEVQNEQVKAEIHE